MPLGDSITLGASVAGGYRAPLYASLTGLGYAVDFVGTQTGNGTASLPDSDHEGHSGWTISGIDASVNGFLDAVAEPDVVLLHIGTNDANTPSTFSNAVDRLDALITKIALKRPSAHIIVTSLLPRGEPAINLAITNQFNPAVPVKVAAQAALGRRVTFLDMYAYLTTADLADTAHPNQTGYNKMAAAWVPAITNLITPVAVSTGGASRGYENNVADSAGYALVYSLDIPNSANYSAAAPVYSVDNHAAIGAFSRVAYYMELQKPGGNLTFVWASMDAFTNNPAALGVPTPLSGAVYQRSVSHLTVESNDPDITSGSDFTGNLEFWPNSYVYANSANVPGASTTTCDFGDGIAAGNYGSMQVHNTTLGKTLLAFNGWCVSGACSIGIGNQPTGQPDWTFNNNDSQYSVKTLQVLVYVGDDTTPPTLTSALPDAARTNVTVRFSEPLAPSSVNGACFSLNNGVQVIGATLAANRLDVVLLTTRLPDGVSTLSVTGVRDSAAGNPIAPGSSIAVDCGATLFPLPAEVAANVPQAAGYQLVCSVTNIPVQGYFNTTSYYSTDNRASIGAFSRVAYYLELKKTGEEPSFIWTSMDAFTADAMKLGVPVVGTFFQQKVTRLDVRSNVSGVTNGTGIATGNIEFWPSDYSMGNGLPIPGANANAFDFGDTGGNSNSAGHACMQVHNYGARQTLFAVNHYNKGNTVALGIGNNPTPDVQYPDPDWTATYNAASYERRVLHVFVLPGTVTGADTNAPTLSGALASTALNSVLVSFSETVADSAASAGSYSLNNGVTVTGATLLPDAKSVCLTTTALTPGQTYQVSVSGVRDRSSSGNLIAAGASVSFAAPSAGLPAILSGNVPESSEYDLIYQLAIPSYASDLVGKGAPYSIDESLFQQAKTQPFDRVAYCLELVTNGVTQWAYVSMDAFTGDIAKIGVPVAARGAAFQTYVSNMNVYASANAPVTNGTNIVSGNIEFWASNYTGPNSKNIPGAVGDKTFDFGDSGGTATVGHGSMQVHNYLAGHTILSLSRFGAATTTELALGIGNNTEFTYGSGYEDPDWSLHPNAHLFSAKNLYVLARWGGARQGTVPVLLAQPVGRTVLIGEPVRMYVQASGATAYQWRRDGVAIEGANQAWLEIGPAAQTDAGTYEVQVFGSGTACATSQAAVLRVIARGTLIRLR